MMHDITMCSPNDNIYGCMCNYRICLSILKVLKFNVWKYNISRLVLHIGLYANLNLSLSLTVYQLGKPLPEMLFNYV